MASIFTYQDEPHRVHSPWSTPGSNTPQLAMPLQANGTDSLSFQGLTTSITKLEPEKHDGPIEYKLHLLLRWRRAFTHTSTTAPAWSNQQHNLEILSTSAAPSQQGIVPKSTYQPSTQHRQARLQQLTTQLLWRLQQSSPFHSSSNQNLVLPVLPEATPRLDLPDRSAKLLPGLEESQGALYEIGVADDGTLVGLADEEMEESLANLRAMAASLGCMVEVHRRVIVGECSWDEIGIEGQTTSRTGNLWVAEVLVRPDNKTFEMVPGRPLSQPDHRTKSPSTDAAITSNHHLSTKEHLRITLVGATGSGKSSLLGTLTSSILDDGRGKSRLSLLKHRHEMTSGTTSSVAQELLGYQVDFGTRLPLVNYGTGDVSAWPDLHNLADRLIFISDSPGLARYAKSTFRALISWAPAWTLVCVAADDSQQNGAIPGQTPSDLLEQDHSLLTLSVAHLKLALKLGKPVMIVITKMDLATRSGLRSTLGSILTVLKEAGKTPCMLNTATSPYIKSDGDVAAEMNNLIISKQQRIQAKVKSGITDSIHSIPIILTSAVSASGLDDLHAFLRCLPLDNPRSDSGNISEACFRVDEVFAIPPSKVYSNGSGLASKSLGIVLCGTLSAGRLSLGGEVMLGPFLLDNDKTEHIPLSVTGRSFSHQGKASAQPLKRSLSEVFSRSMQNRSAEGNHDAEACYVRVRIVSLRNLRLPVSTMLPGDTGTVGIHFLEKDNIAIDKTRKGMVLIDQSMSLTACRRFTATFDYSDFHDANSPPLLLGGHAIAYINNIRAAVKVIAINLDSGSVVRAWNSNGDAAPVGTSDMDVFEFESDDIPDQDHPSQADLHISFQFQTTAEYVQQGDQVLIVPNISATGPVTGFVPSASIPGFSGFVGAIVDAGG